ncbi:MAG: DNA methyltransferase [Lachnospiraceae bacterium]
MARQVKSKSRVEERGEVFTNEREVNAMLDLVKQETERIDSRFLEPACGEGNFLAEILSRKLAIVKKKYKKSFLDYEKNSMLAAGSIYGVDIMLDNVMACRERMFKIWNKEYKSVCKKECNDETRDAIRLVLEKNIVCGNALSLKCVDENGIDTNEPIVFSEWGFVTGSQIQRKDYTFDEILNGNEEKKNENQLDLFDLQNEPNDEGRFLKQYISHYRKVR